MKRAEVFAEALAMPERARMELAAELLASAKRPTGVLADGSAALASAIARRAKEIDEGRVRLIGKKQAMEMLRDRARGRAVRRRA